MEREVLVLQLEFSALLKSPSAAPSGARDLERASRTVIAVHHDSKGILVFFFLFIDCIIVSDFSVLLSLSFNACTIVFTLVYINYSADQFTAHWILSGETTAPQSLKIPRNQVNLSVLQKMIELGDYKELQENGDD